MKKLIKFLAIASVTAVPLIAAHAIIRHNAGTWLYVGKVGGGQSFSYSASGVAVGDKWVLTARHASSDYNIQFKPDGLTTWYGVQRFQNSWCDLALLQMDPSGSDLPGWYDIYPDYDEVGQTIYIQGYGNTGIYYPLTCKWDTSSAGQSGTYGTNHEGTNVYSSKNLQHYLEFDFDQRDCNGNHDDPLSDGTATTDECTTAAGDSGGPSFILDGSTMKVAGIHIGGGALGSDMSVSRNKLWIAGVMNGSVLATQRGPSFWFRDVGTIVNDEWLDEVMVSDDQRMQLEEVDTSAFTPDVQARFQATFDSAPSSLSLNIEVHGDVSLATTRVSQKIEVYNVSTSTWDLIDLLRNVPTTDTLSSYTLSSPANYLDVNYNLLVRVSWADLDNVSNGWKIKIDRVFFTW